jgi:hypothetical protein
MAVAAVRPLINTHEIFFAIHLYKSLVLNAIFTVANGMSDGVRICAVPLAPQALVSEVGFSTRNRVHANS